MPSQRQIADELEASENGLFILETPCRLSTVYDFPSTHSNNNVCSFGYASLSSSRVELIMTASKRRFKFAELLVKKFHLLCHRYLYLFICYLFIYSLTHWYFFPC